MKRFLFALVCVSILWTPLASVSIPIGTKVVVRLGSELNSATAKVGESWNGTLAKDIVVNGNVIAKTGDEITGKVTQARSAAKLHAPGQLLLQLTSINRQKVRSNAYNVKAKRQGNGNQEAVLLAETAMTFTITGSR